MKLGPNPTSETITKFFTLHPECIQAIEIRFRDQCEILETDDNYWSSEEHTKKAFYMYYGINNYAKTTPAEIARVLKINIRAIQPKVERVLDYLRGLTKK